MAKHIGIVAMSYEGAALCYQTICAEAASQMGQHIYPEITLHSFPLGQYMQHVSKLDWDGTAQLLLKSVNKVAGAGAAFAICPANTAHEAFDLMRPRSPIPWLHIAEVVAEAAKRQGCSKLGILGTKFLMEGKVYSQILSSRGIEIVIPMREQRERINSLIFEELVKGDFKDSTREYFVNLVDHLTGKGCDAVVMACTEIPLILSPDDVHTPLLDSTRLLAVAALKEALTQES
jgi:aspartate racemase